MKKILLILLLLFTKLSFSQTSLDYMLFDKINQYRVSQNMNALTWSPFIWTVSNQHTLYQSKAAYMGHRELIDVEGYVEVNKLFSRFEEKGVYNAFPNTTTITVAENCLVMDSKNDPDMEKLCYWMLQMWISSPPHKATLLNPNYKYGAVSCIYGTVYKEEVLPWIYSTLNVLNYE